MPDEISVKTPVAVLTLVILIVSVTLNVVKFAQPPQTVQVPVAVPAGGGGSVATLPNGQPNPLAHVPKSPGDAVGMPDASGGTGQ